MTAEEWRAFLVEVRAAFDRSSCRGQARWEWRDLYADDLLKAAEFFRRVADGVEP